MTRFKELARIQAAIKRREKGRGHRMKNGVRLFVFLIVVVVIRTEAQDEVPRIEVGVQYSAINILSSRVGCSGCKVYNHGVGGRFIANFNRALSFECEVDFFPDEGVGASDVEGGRVTAAFFGPKGGYRTRRSEEHTSELQSRGHLVCRLLLEKKKKKKIKKKNKKKKKRQCRKRQ